MDDIQIQIPAFTVLKNGSILKNIFLLRKPATAAHETDQEILLVGRHPNCNIILEHPSISRFHLRIHSNPSSHTLFVIDLSSVHGTWVSGKRIKPGVHVKLKEGDTIKMGGSSRVYELHWVPLSQAYDLGNPFVLSVYMSNGGEGQENQVSDENFPCLDKLETLLLDDDLEGSNFSCSNKSQLIVSETEYPGSLNESDNQLNWSGDNMGDKSEQLNHGTMKDDPASVALSDATNNDKNALNQQKIKTESDHVILFDGVTRDEKGTFTPHRSVTMKVDNMSKDGEEQANQDENCPCLDKLETLLSDDDIENSNLSFSNKIQLSSLKKLDLSPKAYNEDHEIFSTIPATEDSNTLNKSENRSRYDTSEEYEGLSHGTIKDDQVSVALSDATKLEKDQEIVRCNEIHTGSECKLLNQQKIENGSVPVALFGGVIRDENGAFTPDRAGVKKVGIDGERDQEIARGIKIHMDSECELLNDQKVENGSVSVALFDGVIRDENGAFTSDRAGVKTIAIDGEKDQQIARGNKIDMDSECELLNQQKVENSSVSVALFDGVIRDENGAFTPDRAGVKGVDVVGERDQEIASGNGIHMGSSECKLLNQQKIENGSDPVVLFDGVTRDENGAFTPDIAGVKKANIYGEKDQEIARGNECKSLIQQKIENGSVLVAFFDGVIRNENGAFRPDRAGIKKVDIDDEKDQEIARGNEFHTRSECEVLNQQKIENASSSVALFNNVNRDENGSFTPDQPGVKKVDINGEFEQMNQIKMKMESASVVLFDDEVDMGIKLEPFDGETTKKESFFMALPDGIEMVQERNLTPGISRPKEVYMDLFNGLDDNEWEIFTPDKENKNPNACSVKSMKKKAVGPKILGFSKTLFTEVDEIHDVFTPDKVDSFSREEVSCSSENESKSRLMKMEGSCKSIKYPQTVRKVIDSSQNFPGQAKKRWTMVVDTNCLLHTESLKHLKILQGLKGTDLLVPKYVMQELINLKGRHNLPKKHKNDVSSALNWIEECMVDSRWWIHVDEETQGSKVLETALHLRRITTDRQIIILSNDLTLKIKAMANGVMCEAAEEFRRSLVNPFSERFMWVGSLARGLTWSCADDEKYGEFGLKGLKALARAATFRELPLGFFRIRSYI